MSATQAAPAETTETLRLSRFFNAPRHNCATSKEDALVVG